MMPVRTGKFLVGSGSSRVFIRANGSKLIEGWVKARQRVDGVHTHLEKIGREVNAESIDPYIIPHKGIEHFEYSFYCLIIPRVQFEQIAGKLLSKWI